MIRPKSLLRVATGPGTSRAATLYRIGVPVVRRWVAPVAIILLLTSALAFVATLERVPVVWFDEIIQASASLSLAEGGPGAPTIVQRSELTPPLTLFYGPVWFYAGAVFFDLFGFSINAYRSLCLLSAAVMALSCAYLVRVLGGSRELSLVCAALLLLSPEFGSHAASGRMDMLAVGFQLLGLALFLAGHKRGRGLTGLGLSVASGSSWAVAGLTTPRSLPFLASVSVCSLLLAAGSQDRARTALRCGIALAIPALGVAAWAWSFGLTPWAWVAFIAAQSAGDALNSSGLLGGRWNFKVSVVYAVTPLLIALVMVYQFFARASEADARPTLSVATGRLARVDLTSFTVLVLAINAALMLCLISRPASYNLYWAVPLLPVALALSQRRLERGAGAKLVLLLILWLTLGSAYILLRAYKLAEVAESWEQRDPSLLEQFVRDNIPPGSRVIGPASFYWYAVEGSGSDYYYDVPHPDWPGVTTRGLRSAVVTGSGREGRDYDRTFLIYPGNGPLPQRFESRRRLHVATFSPPASKAGWFLRFNRYSGGYPSSSLYLLLDE